MKILQITPRLPYPLDDGGAIGIYYITSSVAARGHAIRMISFSRFADAPRELNTICSARTVVAATGHSLAKVLRSFFSSMPYMVYKYQHRSMYAAICEEIERWKPDVIHADHLAMAPYALYAQEKYDIPIVLREHNLETVFLNRLRQQMINPLLKAFAWIETMRMRRYEPIVCALFDRCVAITPNDAADLKMMAPRAKIAVIPAGVIMPEVIDVAPEAGASILFLASLSWEPNVDGYFWFHEEVLPLLIQKYPDVRVTIIGKGNNQKLQSIHHPNVEFVGYVDNVAPYLQRSQLCIVPLFVGSGMRIKILEMMAYGKAVVSTTIGCEGIDVISGHNIIAADTPDTFAGAVLRVLGDAELRMSLGTNARMLVQEKYSWKSVAARFEDVYANVIHMRSQQPTGEEDVWKAK